MWDYKVLKTIIQDLYYPKSPYEFSVIGAEILGNVYEQFLGAVIRLTARHQAKVETKPEEIAAIKILDPACGSDSFLIGAYSYLLRYHLDWDDDKKGFGEIMRHGGFDCVVGNPPYVRIQNLDKQQMSYLMNSKTSKSESKEIIFLIP